LAIFPHCPDIAGATKQGIGLASSEKFNAALVSRFPKFATSCGTLSANFGIEWTLGFGF
jgi:hypothetical protein